MKIRFFAIILVNVIFLSNTFSQTRSNYINFETLDIESDLSQNYVNCIFEDNSGLIWIGTDDGLNRYDGINFLKYFNDFKIKNSISGGQITDIVEDKNNNLWISTKEDGLNKLNSDRKFFTSYFNKPEKYNYFPNISNLEYDGNTKIWFLTDNKIYSFDIVSEILQNIKLEVDTSFIISDFIISNENELLISSQKNTFLRYDIVNNKISKKYSLDENASITTIFELKNKIIIGTFEGEIFIFDTETETYESIFKSVVLKQNQGFLFGRDTSKITFTAMDICVGNDNKILILGRESLVTLDLFPEDIIRPGIKVSYHILDFAGNCIMKDKSGNLWLGTNGKGVKIYNEKFNNFRANYNFDDFQTITSVKSIRTIGENADYFFVGGYYGLLFINKITFEITDFLSEVQKYNLNTFFIPKGEKFEPAVYCILPDPDKPDEIIWIGIEGYCSGLYKYSLKTGKLLHLPMNGDKDDFASNFLFDICADKSGNLWLAGDYGAYKFNRETEQFTFFQNQKKNSNSIQAGKITTIYSDNNNVLWFGSIEDGVSYLDKNTGNFVHFREDKNSQNSLPSNSILVIYQDKNHRHYWFGTVGSGLSKYDFENKTFKNYTMNDGLPNNVIYGILEDDNGNLWLSTNYGISKFNIATESFTNYSTSDGLTNIEYNTGAYFKNSEGLLFFGGIKGFDYFNPDEIFRNDYQPPILLISIKINNIELYADSALNSLKRLEASYLDNLISIEFAALSYFQSSENQYSYILEGVYTDWVNIGTKNTITLSGLKSGNYTLKIKASNNDGVWNETAYELPIYISPPIWEKWWFIVFSSAIFIIIVLLILRYRQIQFLRKQKYLEFIISERTSEIQNQKEELQENADNLEKAFEMVNTLSLTKDKMSSMLVHDLKNPLNSIINYARLIQKTENPKIHDISEKSTEIEKSALGLLTLVNNLLDIAKMEEAKMQISIVGNSLNRTINEALAQINYPAKEKQIEIENKISFEIEAEFDSNLIVRVLVNLLTNAIKFSEKNSKISIDYEIYEDEIKIKITDFGAGIPQEYLDKVFDKFVQSEVRKLGITQSTGLGLTFSKLAIEAHNRQIGVISNIGEGSTFWFTLKLLTTNLSDRSKRSDEYTQNIVLLTNNEISEVIKLLNSLKFFQTGEIFAILASSKFSSSEFLKWKKEVEKAVLYTNEEYYEALTKL